MRYLGYTLASESTPIPPPTPELMEEMGKFIEEATSAGVFLTGGGMAPTAEGARVIYEQGEFTVIDGPFAEGKEIIGGWALLECRDLDEAVEWTKRFLAVAGEGESRIRPVY